MRLEILVIVVEVAIAVGVVIAMGRSKLMHMLLWTRAELIRAIVTTCTHGH